MPLGEVSPYLVDEVRPGDLVEVRGPVGGWFVWEARDGGPLLLVAGGSGLAPLMAMLRHRAAAGGDAEATLLLSARRPDDVLYARELEALDGVRVEITYTRSAPEGWTGYARRVDRTMLAEVAPQPAQAPRVFVCGPTTSSRAWPATSWRSATTHRGSGRSASAPREDEHGVHR